MKKLITILAGILLSFSVWAIDVGDAVEVLNGPDEGLQGVVVKIYVIDDVETFAIKFDDEFYGMYTESDLEEVK